MQDTPRSLRLSIGLFGRRNVGKSALMNALCAQELAIVSPQAGTTTDPVEKSYELAPLGPVVFIDTAGIDDEGPLGEQRIAHTHQALKRCDVALIVCDNNGLGEHEQELLRLCAAQATPAVLVCNKTDLGTPDEAQLATVAAQITATVHTSTFTQRGIDALRHAIAQQAPQAALAPAQLLGDLIKPGELVLLVVPLDLGAPKGRLILPQVQALRDILDSDAMSMVVKERELALALRNLKQEPRLVVCDSQVVLKAAADTPAHIPLTTFSILLSRMKGDMLSFARGAAALHRLQAHDRVLIAEACSHHAQADDIGRVKIPRWLRQFAGGQIETELCAGRDFPQDLRGYAMVIQCGSCMVTRREVLARQRQAEVQGVAMTNYGMAISVVQGVLERTLACFPAGLTAYLQARGSGTGD